MKKSYVFTLVIDYEKEDCEKGDLLKALNITDERFYELMTLALKAKMESLKRQEPACNTLLALIELLEADKITGNEALFFMHVGYTLPVNLRI